jgi:hypothetical protein
MEEFMARHKLLMRGLLLSAIVAFVPLLTGLKLHNTKDVIDEAKAAVAAAEPKVTRYGVYEFSMAKGLVDAAQAEYDEMDYTGAECFAKKAMKLAEEATTKQAF